MKKTVLAICTINTRMIVYYFGIITYKTIKNRDIIINKCSQSAKKTAILHSKTIDKMKKNS